MKKLSIDRIGTRGSVALLVIGILCLVFGVLLQIRANDLPSDAVECTAVIEEIRQPTTSKIESPTTLVKYTLDGISYTRVPLGQYEGSWKVGDQITIYCSEANPMRIWTKTMQYRGFFYIMFSASLLLVAVYKLLQFRKIKGVNDNESDIDESGEEKFKISSFIIPLAAGIPFTINGIFYWIIEESFLGFIIVLLGSTAVLTGVASLCDFIRSKLRKNPPKKNIKVIPENISAE